MFNFKDAEKTIDYYKKNINYSISALLKLTLVIGAILMFFQGRYQAVFETLVILFITFLPMLLGKRFQVRIPHVFEFMAVVFVFLSLFLGEVQQYYVRFWWWDAILHTGSGFLLGVVGFLLVYVLNEKKEIDLDINPDFVAMFAFMFAMGMGALWEIFEFGMDQLFGMNMQKSGLIDTMWDLIVDAIGAGTISILGRSYIIQTEKESFLERWIHEFLKKNPRFAEPDQEQDKQP